jgi:hypothetical protein
MAEPTTPDRRLGETGGAGATQKSGRIEPIAMVPADYDIRRFWPSEAGMKQARSKIFPMQ